MRNYSNVEKVVLDHVVRGLINECEEYHANAELIEILFGKIFIIEVDSDHFFEAYYCDEKSNEWVRVLSSADFNYLKREIEIAENSGNLLAYMWEFHNEYY
ncbi:MAG: hypothetical protein RSC93_00370 [Erysipelotrichaceae bacterium]